MSLLTGKSQEHLVLDEQSKLFIHKDALPALNLMRKNANAAGFDLKLSSAFRSFDHQLLIWNAKAQGLRPLYDDNGILLDYKNLSSNEILYAILRWSALPGASRHHWGTDIDVYDSSRMPEDYKVQLTPQETNSGGVFADFHLWLDDHLEEFNFYRPYSMDTGGIAPERWHLSYKPLSEIFQRELTYELVEQTISDTDIELKDLILAELPDIYQRFIDI